MKVIFVSSRLRSDTDDGFLLNQERARKFGLFVAEKFGHVPIIPHITYTQFMDDDKHEHRTLALNFCKRLVHITDELWVFIVDEISEGMQIEIDEAFSAGKKIRFFKELPDGTIQTTDWI